MTLESFVNASPDCVIYGRLFFKVGLQTQYFTEVYIKVIHLFFGVPIDSKVPTFDVNTKGLKHNTKVLKNLAKKTR